MAQVVIAGNTLRIEGVRGLDFDQFKSVMRQAMDLPGCPDIVVVEGQRMSVADASSNLCQRLLWEKI